MSEFNQQRQHYTLSLTGLVINPSCPYEVWEYVGQYLGGLQRSINWAIGDWLNHGQDTFPDRYAQALDSTDYHYASLVNAAWVARHVGRDRRRDDLTWSHHAEVAGLPAAEQDDWLARAAAEGWSVRRLREELAPYRRENHLPGRDPHLGEGGGARREARGGGGGDPLEHAQRAYLQLSQEERREFRRWLAARREANVEG